MNVAILFHGILLGMRPTKLEIMPLGLSISFKLKLKDYNTKIFKSNLLELKKIIVAGSGPVTNFLIIILIVLFKPSFIENETAIYANLLIVAFNIIPIYPLDGGRILKSIIHINAGGRTAIIVTNKVANGLMITVTLIGSIAIFYFKNISIFFIIMFLWILVIKENKKYKMLINAYNLI